MTNLAAEMTRLEKQMSRTQHLIELREIDRAENARAGETSEASRIASSIARMERNQARRERELRDLAARTITGQSWRGYAQTIKGTYRPSLDTSRFPDFAVRVFVAEFEREFGRAVYAYTPARISRAQA